MIVPRGLVQLALLVVAVALLVAAVGSGVWGGLALLALIACMSLLATTWKATP